MDVDKLRAILMEIGNQQFHLNQDERRMVGNSNTIKTLFPRINEVIGVWLADDYEKTGTNYAIGGGSDQNTIYLGVPLPAGTEVSVSYIIADGLNDITAQTVIDWAEVEVKADLLDFTLDLINPTTNEERTAAVYWEMLTMANAYLLLNNVNFVQSDANISMFNYQTMSKLWGEGMSTDALFNRLFQRISMVRNACFMLLSSASTFVSEEIQGFWKDDNMLTDWLYDLKQNNFKAYEYNQLTFTELK